MPVFASNEDSEVGEEAEQIEQKEAVNARLGRVSVRLYQDSVGKEEEEEEEKEFKFMSVEVTREVNLIPPTLSTPLAEEKEEEERKKKKKQQQRREKKKKKKKKSKSECESRRFDTSS